MSNAHVSESNNWRDRLVGRGRGAWPSGTRTYSRVWFCASQDLAGALGCEGGDGGQAWGWAKYGFVLCVCVCVCVAAAAFMPLAVLL